MKQVNLVIPLVSLLLVACGVSETADDRRASTSKSKGSFERWQSDLLGQEGHGGDAIVCFSIPIDQALYQVGNTPPNTCPPNEKCSDKSESRSGKSGSTSGIYWRMTDAGRSSIRSAKPLEQYLGERISSKKTVIESLNQLSTEDGYQKLLKPYMQLPAPFARIAETHQKFGWLNEDGISSEYGLIDVKDSGFINESEIDQNHCKELQAVVRRDNQLWYDADIVRHFDNAGRVLIQLHEEIYAWGKQQDEINLRATGIPVHQTSTKTRRLILKMLDENIDSRLLNENLKSLGFSTMYWENLFQIPTPVGYFMDSDTCKSEQSFLNNVFKNGTLSGRDYWLSVADLFTNRYLKSSQSWGILELRNNFPDALSNMIALTMNSRGSSPTFPSEINALRKIFERPESCVGRF
jgi:hypothetical protein